LQSRERVGRVLGHLLGVRIDIVADIDVDVAHVVGFGGCHTDEPVR